MIIKVLIRRRIQENYIRKVFELLKKLRIGAMNQPGYISGETLVDQFDPQRIMVVSIWQTVEDWIRWQENDERKSIEVQLERVLLEPTKYETYDVVSTKLWTLI